MSRVPLTTRGAKMLREELDRLKSKDRPRVIAAIAEARAHGDLKENAEYHAAREEQGFIEGRLADIESKLSHAHVIDLSKIPQDGRVVFGVTVNLVDVDTEEKLCYRLVGEDEADVSAGLLSVNTPIARALIGKVEGDEVEVQVPSGSRTLELVSVQYLP